MVVKKRISRLIKPKPEINYHRPILRGFLIGKSIVVHCPFCDKFHVHGWDPKLTARDIYYPGAHCNPKYYPFGEPGVLYGVSPFRKADLKALEKRQEQAEQYAYLKVWKVTQDCNDAKEEKSK